MYHDTVQMLERIFAEFFEAVVDFTNALTVPHSLDEKDW